MLFTITDEHWENDALKIYCKKHGYNVGEMIESNGFGSFVRNESRKHREETGNVNVIHFHEWLKKKYEHLLEEVR